MATLAGDTSCAANTDAEPKVALIEAALTDYWGKRCPDYVETCHTCNAWAELDRLKGG